MGECPFRARMCAWKCRTGQGDGRKRPFSLRPSGHARCASYRAIGLGLLAAICWPLRAAQLPLRRYTTAEGLAANGVYSIVSDARGFLWFATAEGLSRFDGFGFANQNGSSGLPDGIVTQLLIGRGGNYWLATPSGLVRYRPDLPPSSAGRVLLIRPEGQAEAAHISSLLEDRGGRLWCGTHAGLYTLDDAGGPAPRLSAVPIGLPGAVWADSAVSGLAEDTEGALWIGVADGNLYRRMNGRVERFASSEPAPHSEIMRLFGDRRGRIWVGRANSLYRSSPAAHPGANGFERLSGRNGLPDARAFDIFETRDGDVWVGMYRYLAQFPAGEAPARVWAKENGLPSRGVGTLGQDRDGNLWLGTGDVGAFKLAAGGNLTYSAADGIGMDAVISVAETLSGELYLAGRQESEGFRIAIRSGDGFRALAPRVPENVRYFGWRPARVILQDRTGEWWLASSQGLCRYPRLESASLLAQTLPMAVYTTRDGLPGDVVTRLYEDRAGNIWAGTETGTFAFWSRSARKFVTVAAGGISSFASAFGEDHAGHVWVGDEEGQLWKVQDGRARLVGRPVGKTSINALLTDHAGRLWVATGGRGLLRFDQPEADVPQFRQYGFAGGLSSLNLYSLAEDRQGSIYIGTGSGVDRLDPDRAHLRHYTSADGIAAGEVNVAYSDRGGAMWFGTNHGLTRLMPQDGPLSDPPPVWITGLSIAGRRAPVSEVGESIVRQVRVEPGQEHIQFDFVGLSYSPGNVLRYEYRVGDGAWSAPIESRSVHYGAFAPGHYRFEVRAINSDGEASPAPAVVEFRVSPITSSPAATALASSGVSGRSPGEVMTSSVPAGAAARTQHSRPEVDSDTVFPQLPCQLRALGVRSRVDRGDQRALPGEQRDDGLSGDTEAIARADHRGHKSLHCQRGQCDARGLHSNDHVIDHGNLRGRSLCGIGRARGLHRHRIRAGNRPRRQIVHLRGRSTGHRLARICRYYTNLAERATAAHNAVHAPRHTRAPSALGVALTCAVSVTR